MKEKLLVTTSLNETMDVNAEMIFLGGWCLKYDKKEYYKNLTYTLADNLWDDRSLLQQSIEYLESLQERLLVCLSGFLNEYHGVKKPIRYWSIILNPWLLTYVSVIFSRWESLRKVFNDDVSYRTIALNISEPIEPALDYSHFVKYATESDYWNHKIFLNIIEYKYSDVCKITRIKNKLKIDKYKAAGVKKSFYEKLIASVDYIIGKIPIKNDILFFDSKFRIGSLIKLNFVLRQIPRLYCNEFLWPDNIHSEIEDCKPNLMLRNNLDLNIESENDFESFLFSQILKDIPLVHLEYYPYVRKNIESINYSIKLICTANALWTNEIFKAWCAEQVNKGVKLLGCEHGGAIPPRNKAFYFEEKNCDYFAVWSKPYNSKHIRLPPSKIIDRKLKNFKKENCSVIGLEVTRYPLRLSSSPISEQVLETVDMVCELYKLLETNVQSKFKVKPYPNRGWHSKQRYKDKLGDFSVYEESNYYNVLAKSRLVVCTYPQTTLSEAMASGIPTILMYPSHHWENPPEFDELIDILKANNILFTDAASAALHINNVWSNIECWWGSKNVIYARNKFNEYCLNPELSWLEQWKSKLLSIIND